MSRTAELDAIRESFYHYFELMPETGELFVKHYHETYKDGALDEKTKRLIALCGALIAGCKGCILGHANHAINKGATAQEILEACSVAVSLGGTLAGTNMTMLIEFLKEKEVIE